MLLKDKAFCIRTVDYSETSQIVTLFTLTAGKISAIAKGTRKIKPSSSSASAVEVLSCGSLVLSYKENDKLAVLTEFESSAVYSGLRKNLDRLNAAVLAAETIDKFLKEHDPHPELFRKFAVFLKKICDARQYAQILAKLIKFQIELLAEIGSSPLTAVCVNCKNPYNSKWPAVFFSCAAGGIVCRDCESGFSDRTALNDKLIKILNNTAVSAAEAELKSLEAILLDYFAYLAAGQLKMARYFRRL